MMLSRLPVALLALSANPGFAQITVDGSLGPPGVLAGPDYTIPAEVGRQVDSNLFHSFGEFNVNTGESATFTGPGAISNIIARVTGGRLSNIDGTLRTDVSGGTNLWLTNPAGIVFGANAQLEIQGSFHASTADYLSLGNDGRFDATQAQNTVLTSAPPSAFGFLGRAQSFIDVDGAVLETTGGAAFSLVGGDIAVRDAGLVTPGGNLQLASVAGAAELAVDAGDSTLSGQGAEIAISGSSLIASADNGGRITIRGGQITLTETQVFSDNIDQPGLGIGIEAARLSVDNSDISNLTTGSAEAGPLQISADSIDILGADADTRIGSFSECFGEDCGPAGDVVIEARAISLTNGGFFSSRTFGDGDGGNILIVTSEFIDIFGVNASGFASGIYADTGEFTEDPDQPVRGGFGASGNIFVSTPLLTVGDGGIITSRSICPSCGDASLITIEAERIRLLNGGSIDSSSFSSGEAGAIIVDATESLTLDGGDILSDAEGPGPGGFIRITTPFLDVNGGSIDSDSLCPDCGEGGAVIIDVGQLQVSNEGSIRTDTLGDNPGGAIVVTAAESVTLGTGGSIAAVTESAGSGGGIVISTPVLTIEESGLIDASTSGLGEAGAIIVDATESLRLDGGAILSDAGGPGAGGFIQITTPFLGLNGGEIDSDSLCPNCGVGGAIVIDVGRLQMENGSSIQSDTVGNNPGGAILIIASESVDIAGGSAVATTTAGDGASGDIEISTSALSLRNGGFVDASTFSRGEGGSVTVIADRSVDILDEIDQSGQRSPDDFASGIYAQTEQGSGSGGVIQVATPDLNIQGGVISSGSLCDDCGNADTVEIVAERITIGAGGTIESSTRGDEDGGNVTVVANESIMMQGISADGQPSSISADTLEGRGEGGLIDITTPILTMTEGAEISASSVCAICGDAGDITVRVDEVLHMENGSRISTTTAAAGGGSITIVNHRLVTLIDSELATEVAGGGSNAGNITIAQPQVFTLIDESLMSANAFEGLGGNVLIVADSVLRSPGSAITASSQVAGNEGMVVLQSPDTDVSSGLAVLSSDFSDAGRLLRAPCGVRRSDEISTFSVADLGNLPPPPDAYLAATAADIDTDAEPWADLDRSTSAYAKQDLFSLSVESGDCVQTNLFQ